MSVWRLQKNLSSLLGSDEAVDGILLLGTFVDDGLATGSVTHPQQELSAATTSEESPSIQMLLSAISFGA